MTKQPQTTATVIQATYPSPQSVRGGATDRYCVLGSALLFAGYPPEYRNRYPSPGHGAESLQKLNSRLNWTAAMSFAFDISTANDEGLFNEAWRLLGAALRYGRE